MGVGTALILSLRAARRTPGPRAGRPPTLPSHFTPTVDAPRGGEGALIAADVALDELHLAADGRQILATAGGEVVEHAHGAA